MDKLPPEQKRQSLGLVSENRLYPRNLLFRLGCKKVRRSLCDVLHGVFYALLPTFDDPQSELESEGTYYIFEVIEEDGEEQLAEVEDDELLDKLAAIFESRFEELYEDSDEE